MAYRLSNDTLLISKQYFMYYNTMVHRCFINILFNTLCFAKFKLINPFSFGVEFFCGVVPLWWKLWKWGGRSLMLAVWERLCWYIEMLNSTSFESQIRRASECETSPIKIMYLFKYEAMSVWIDVLAQEDLSAILYLHNIYNVGRISIYVIKTHSETLSPAIVETQDHYVSNMNERFMDLEAGDLAEILRKTVRTSNQLPTS